MKRGSNTVIPYEDIDHELVELIKCINDVEGIETVECCCGHGTEPCQIWFVADSLKDVTHFIHNYLYCNRLWRITIDITDVDIDENKWDSPTYLLETTCNDYYYTGVCIDNLTYKMTMKNQDLNQNTTKWIDEADKIDAQFGKHTYKCSKCSKYAEYFISGTEVWWDRIKPNYCPNCGAKMEVNK